MYLDSIALDGLKMKTNQQCNILGVGGGRGPANPEVCLHFQTLSVRLQHAPAPSPSCMHRPQYIFPKLQPLKRAKPSVD